METLYLKRGEDRRLRAGHLWVFSNEVDVKRSPLTAFAPGQAVNVADAGERMLGTAYVNPASSSRRGWSAASRIPRWTRICCAPA